MKTLAQSWADRLLELCQICKDSGETLDKTLREGYARQHADDWWKAFCDAAESGEVLSPSVWRSAHVESEKRRMVGWFNRLVTRNEVARGN